MEKEKKYLMDDPRARFPESHPILGPRGGQEVVDLQVDSLSLLQVSCCSWLSLDQVVTVDGGGDGHLQVEWIQYLLVLSSKTPPGFHTEGRGTGILSPSKKKKIF